MSMSGLSGKKEIHIVIGFPTKLHMIVRVPNLISTHIMAGTDKVFSLVFLVAERC